MASRSHLVIPDTQIRQGVPLRHLDAIGRLIAEIKPSVVIQLGDWFDMPSLSAYDEGKLPGEGLRVQDDIDAGNSALERLMHYMGKRHRPRLVYLLGNHENRIHRYVADHPKLQGVLGCDSLAFQTLGWEQHGFLDPVEIHGISYAHFFPRSSNGRITQSKHGAPSALQQVKREMTSCTAGHQQGFSYDMYCTRKQTMHGLIVGSCYLHRQTYIPSSAHYWRGIVVKDRVSQGNYDVKPIRLSALVR